MRKYRGMPPGLWELYHGEKEIGITVQKIAAGLDCGLPIEEKHIPIRPDDTLGALQARLRIEGQGLLYAALKKVADPDFTPAPVRRVGRGLHVAQFPTMGHSERTDHVPPLALPMVRSVPGGFSAFAGAVKSLFSKPALRVD